MRLISQSHFILFNQTICNLLRFLGNSWPKFYIVRKSQQNAATPIKHVGISRDDDDDKSYHQRQNAMRCKLHNIQKFTEKDVSTIAMMYDVCVLYVLLRVFGASGRRDLIFDLHNTTADDDATLHSECLYDFKIFEYCSLYIIWLSEFDDDDDVGSTLNKRIGAFVFSAGPSANRHRVRTTNKSTSNVLNTQNQRHRTIFIDMDVGITHLLCYSQPHTLIHSSHTHTHTQLLTHTYNLDSNQQGGKFSQSRKIYDAQSLRGGSSFNKHL